MQNEPKRWRKRWKLVVAYDGTDFSGWQVQPERATIQGTLMEAIKSITGEDAMPQGSGRTDAGVHAEGQVASLPLRADIPPENLLRALNRVLPGSIRVLSAERMHPKFHARANVVSKTYRYRIFVRRPDEGATERICPPPRARYVWDCPFRLNVAAMQQAAAAVIGTHDFTSFAALDPDRAARLRGENADSDDTLPTNVRTIYESRWEWQEDELVYTVNGSGFLHHMVRNLVGTFVEIGTGRLEKTVEEILAARDRAAAGATCPPQGLSLVRVFYKGEQP